MKLSKFKFNLPQELIALHPAKNRDESRLMVIDRKTGEIEHKVFKDLLSYFGEKDVFIFNNTKVFPARLYGNKEKTGARIEVFLLRELNEDLRLWDVLVDPARKIRIGNKLYFGEDDSMVAEVIDNTTSRGRTLRFLYDGNHDEFKKALYALGETPLPKYIDRPVEADDEAIKQPGDPFDLLAEAAGIAALSAEDYRKMSLEFLQNERWRLFDELGKLGFRMWKPSANYVFFQAEQCPDLDRQLLSYGILLRHCDTYDGLDATYYRAAVRLPEENQYLLHCLRCILGEEGLLWQQNH